MKPINKIIAAEITNGKYPIIASPIVFNTSKLTVFNDSTTKNKPMIVEITQPAAEGISILSLFSPKFT